MKSPLRAIGGLLILAGCLLFGYLIYDASELTRLVNLQPEREGVVAILGLGIAAGAALIGGWLIRGRSVRG